MVTLHCDINITTHWKICSFYIFLIFTYIFFQLFSTFYVLMLYMCFIWLNLIYFSQSGNVCLLMNKFILLAFNVITDITELISSVFHCAFWLIHFWMLLASYFYSLWLIFASFGLLFFYTIHNLHSLFQFFNWLPLQFCHGHKTINQFLYSLLEKLKEFNSDSVSPGDNVIL